MKENIKQIFQLIFILTGVLFSVIIGSLIIGIHERLKYEMGRTMDS